MSHLAKSWLSIFGPFEESVGMTLSRTPEGNRKEKAKESQNPHNTTYKREEKRKEGLYDNPLFVRFEGSFLSYFSIGKLPKSSTPNSDLAVSIELQSHKVLTPQILRPTCFS